VDVLMKQFNLLTSPLLSVVLFIASSGFLSAEELIPENDYGKIESQIRKVEKDTSAVEEWIGKNIKPMANTNHMFSAEFLKFTNDKNEVNYEGTMSAEQLRQKWGNHFDLGRTNDHPFETGNCGWDSRKLAKFEHLGELNGGDWFRLTIAGGCQKNDYSETVVRVVKVVSIDGKFQIANLFCL